MALESRTKSVWPTFIWATLAFCLLGFASVLGVHLFGGEAKEYDTTRARERLENRKKLEAEEHAQLDNYAWVDKEKGTVRLPVSRAMEVALSELKQKPVGASAVPVVAPVAPPAAVEETAPAPADPAAAPAETPEAENPSPATP